MWFFNERRKNSNFKWNHFKEGLMAKYTNTCDTLMAAAKIMRRKQMKGEPFNNYWESKLQIIESNAKSMPENEKMTHLLNGLEETLYSKVIEKYLGSPPTSIEQLYKMIKLTNDATTFSMPKVAFTQKKTRFDLSDCEQFDSDDSQPKQTKHKHDAQMEKLIKSVQTLTNKMNDQQNRNRWNQQQQRTDNRRPNWPQDRRQTQPNNWSQDRRQAQQSNWSTQPNTSTSNQVNQKPLEQNERPRRDMSQVQCWYCNEFGHYANRCTKKQTSTQSPKNERRQN